MEHLGQPYSIIFSSSFTLGFVVSPEMEHPQQPVQESASIRPAAQQLDTFHPRALESQTAQQVFLLQVEVKYINHFLG